MRKAEEIGKMEIISIKPRTILPWCLQGKATCLKRARTWQWWPRTLLLGSYHGTEWGSWRRAHDWKIRCQSSGSQPHVELPHPQLCSLHVPENTAILALLSHRPSLHPSPTRGSKRSPPRHLIPSPIPSHPVKCSSLEIIEPKMPLPLLTSFRTLSS